MSGDPELRPPAVVCIAASTGGPQAIGAFLEQLTGAPPCPVLIVQHLPASFTGRFADRLAHRYELGIREARSGTLLRSGEIIVAPGDSHLRVRHRRVRLDHEPPIGGLRPRADLTLADLADEFGAGTTAVVLSGVGSDGVDGARAVRDAGGQVLVQDRASCIVDGMPARIRAARLASLTGPPGALAAALEDAWRSDRTRTAHRSRRTTRTSSDDAGPTRGAITRHARRGPEAATRVFGVLQRREGIDLRSFKAPQLLRNLTAFATQHGWDLDLLSSELERHPELRQALLDRITINVTGFFRDRARWDDLAELVVPTLGPAPHIWNPGCADGSETCSIAMVVAESGRHPRIWATDVNRSRIRSARRGTYDDLAVSELPDGPHHLDRRARWFARHGDTWTIDPEIRSTIRYDQHDVIDGPATSPVRPPFQLVVCRNLMIYLNQAGRERLLDAITTSLELGGSLLLGGAERILRPETHGLERIAPGLYRRTEPWVGS